MQLPLANHSTSCSITWLSLRVLRPEPLRRIDVLHLNLDANRNVCRQVLWEPEPPDKGHLILEVKDDAIACDVEAGRGGVVGVESGEVKGG